MKDAACTLADPVNTTHKCTDHISKVAEIVLTYDGAWHL